VGAALVGVGVRGRSRLSADGRVRLGLSCRTDLSCGERRLRGMSCRCVRPGSGLPMASRIRRPSAALGLGGEMVVHVRRLPVGHGGPLVGLNRPRQRPLSRPSGHGGPLGRAGGIAPGVLRLVQFPLPDGRGHSSLSRVLRANRGRLSCLHGPAVAPVHHPALFLAHLAPSKVWTGFSSEPRQLRCRAAAPRRAAPGAVVATDERSAESPGRVRGQVDLCRPIQDRVGDQPPAVRTDGQPLRTGARGGP
jgi:hypothetical protein